MQGPVGRHHRYTYGDYLAFEDASNVKHEFLDGEIYAMAGGIPTHAALAMTIGAALVEQLRGKPCRVMGSDLRIRVLATGLVTYPDVTVVCGPLERDPESRTTVTNPSVVVEVLSDGTEDYDRGEKIEHYRQVASLRECLLVSHREPRLDLWRRTPDGSWEHWAATGGQILRLESLGCELAVDDVYRDGLEEA
jgi:Uma2 family endonuclease